MNINNVLKRQTTIIAISVICLCLGLIGVSYAVFFAVDDSKVQKVTSGYLVIKFESTTQDIDTLPIDSTVPISDSDGEKSTGYSFSVTNIGSLPMKYNIYLYDDPEVTEEAKADENKTMLAHEYLKIKLDNEPTKKLSDFTDKVTENGVEKIKINSKELGVAAKGSVDEEENPTDVKTHNLRIWIDDSAPEEIVGNIVALQLEVFGEAGKPPRAFSEVIVADGTNIINDGTTEGNLRYVGANPNNYIWFNCNNYDYITDAQSAEDVGCEKWRIIGLFNNIKTVTEDGQDKGIENLVKIIRDKSIGSYSWDNKDVTTGAEDDKGKNDWTTAELMYLLNSGNGTHTLNGVLANNSLYWESEEGQCSNDQNNATTNCDFKSTGLKGDDNGPTKSLIESVEWNLGGLSDNVNTAAAFYAAERGKSTYQDKRPTTWNGKVGIMYPSDYGYAAGSACLTTTLNIYGTSCKDSDWLYYNENQWLLTPRPDSSYMINNVNKDPGGVGHWYASNGEEVRPTLYLTSKVGIKDIANLDETNPYGSENNPYILEIEH